MPKLLNPSNKKDLDFYSIHENIVILENILKKFEIQNELDFKIWVKDFEKIYGKKQVDLQLYIVSALIYFLGHLFISKFILKNEKILTKNRVSLKNFKEFEDSLKSNFPTLNIFDINYFTPFISISENQELAIFYDLLLNISNIIFNLNIKPEYIFDYLIQNIISPLTRHKSGEYYTPQFLVKQMIRETYLFGESVLDPCCGSGNFLTEIIKHILSHDKPMKRKITALNNIYGYDINPISIYVSKINLFLILKDFIPDIVLNLYVFDFLFQRGRKFNKKFDLIIGNPPWYTYRDIETVEHQNNVKKLSELLEIKPLPKNLLNLEISTLFFAKANNTDMKDKAKIFFVMTKGVITGSHASRFRNFKDFCNIKIWTFDRSIESLFNIDFICLFAQKCERLERNGKKEIKAYHFAIRNKIEPVEYFKDIELKLERVDLIEPYLIEKKAGKKYTKKLISQGKLKKLYPLKESPYKTLFHKGADLNPRNLIFIKINKTDNLLVKISPEERIFKRAKAPWDKKEFENETIEKKYVFKTIKSTELIKFYVYNYYHVFLPLNKSDLTFRYDKLDKYGKLFYDKINQLYIKYKKETTKHKSLIENLDRWSKLINHRQLSKIKVVYNNSGAILYSAVIQGDFLITGDLSFYSTNDIEEAFYLSAILNSNLMTKQVDIIRSSRHIFKLPLEFPIQKYNNNDPNHQKLAELGRKGQLITKQTVKTFINNGKEEYTKNKIQNEIIEKLQIIFTQIDEILINQLQESKNSN